MTSTVLLAIGRGIVSQFHPKMLALLVVPLFVAIGIWALSAWFFWDPVTDWLRTRWFAGEGWVARGLAWGKDYGLGFLGEWIPNFFAFLLIVPLAIVTALGLIGVVAMPIVLRFLGGSDYSDVARRGEFGISGGLVNLLRTLMVFVPGYLLTMPLWLIPPLALVVPWLWWGWLTARLMRFDSSVEHATPVERARLFRGDGRAFLLLGLACAVLNYFPPLFLVAPVLSALVFGHYSLMRLRKLRVVQAPGPPEEIRS